MKILGGRWDRFWFEPSPASNLGICRLAFFGILFIYYLPFDFSPWAEVSKVFWTPTPVFRILHLPVLSKETLEFLQCLWKTALLLTAIGLWTRLNALISFLLGFYLLGLPHNFGKIHHFDAMVVLILGLMALSRSGDAWSFDRLRRVSKNPKFPASETMPPSGEYTWPVRGAWLVMSLIFFAAGFAKLKNSGLSWVTSENMQILLTQQVLHLSAWDPLFSWGPFLAEQAWLCRLFAGFSLLTETGYPLALFSRRARWFFVPSMAFLLFGIRALMGPSFETFIFCYVFWIPWDRAGEWIRQKFFAGKTKMSVSYDGSCGICARTMSVLRTLDLTHRVVFYDALKDWPEIIKKYPSLKQEACLQDMHAVTPEGKTAAGFDAYRALARVLPLGWLLLPLLYLPPVSAVGKLIYRRTALGRHRGGCTLKNHL